MLAVDLFFVIWVFFHVTGLLDCSQNMYFMLGIFPFWICIINTHQTLGVVRSTFVNVVFFLINRFNFMPVFNELWL